MANSKPKILCHNILEDNSAETATDTDTDVIYSVANVYDWRTYTHWKASSVGTKYLTFEAKEDSTNGDMEAWTGGGSVAPDGWTLYNATIAQESTTVKEGTYSAKLTRTNTEASLYQSLDITAYRGKTITLSGWVSSAYANESRMRIYYIDGTGVNNYSSFHTGGGEWEYLSTSATVPSTATALTVYCEAGNDAGTIAYFDDVRYTETKYRTADSYSIFGHNFLTADASVALEYSYDNFDAIPNGDMEVWTGGASSAPDNWIAYNASIAQEATTIYEGTYSAEITRTTGTEASLWRTLDLETYKGKTIILSGWVNSTYASESRLRLFYVDGGAVNSYSSYHTGSVGWEYLSVSATIPDTATSLRVYCEAGNDVGTVAYYDKVRVDIEALSETTVFSSNNGYLKTFTSQEAPYWRLKIVTTSVVPYVGSFILGDSMDFSVYPQSTFDPTAETIHAKTNRSQTGNLLGSVISYYSRDINVTFSQVEPDWIDDTFLPVWNNYLKTLQPFIWAWEDTNHASEVYFVQLNPNFSLKMPYNPIRRTITLNMNGLSED